MSDTFPVVSIVIPCRNEKDHIEACVRSLLAQEPPSGGFEIIVADGMSDDGTRHVLKRLAEEDARLRVIDNPGRITPCGMNVGIRGARGRYIAIMGAHNRYAPDYLRRSIDVLEETSADDVGGAMVCEAESWLQRAIGAAHHSPFSVGGARWHSPGYEGPADTVFGGVYRREVFDRIGLFDEELARNQDDEFNLRLTRAGGRIWQSPRIKSWYRPRGSLGALFRQYMQYGYWKVRVIQKHKLPASIRHLVPASFLLLLCGLPPASFWWPPAGWSWLGLVWMYSMCNVVTSVLTAARQGWNLLPILPLVFGCYHFAYGFGFLRGIWHFIILQRLPDHAYTELTRTPATHFSRKMTTDHNPPAFSTESMKKQEVHGLPSEPARGEEDRIRAVYASRRGDARFSWFSPGHLYLIQQHERQLLALLTWYGLAPLDTKKILEVGCGTGHWLREFIKWGARPENVTGVDLLPDRVAEARRLCPEPVRVLCGNAAKLTFPDATFDLVLQSTVFTSVLDPTMKQQMASEMLRVVKEDGLILWYDYHVNNPWNPEVRGVKKREIHRLSPGCRIELQRTTLAPPLVRLLAPYSWLICYLLERIPWLCTHYLGVIRKGETDAGTISTVPRP